MPGRLSAMLGAIALSCIATPAMHAQGRGTGPVVAFRAVGTFVSLDSSKPSITVKNGASLAIVIPITSALVKDAAKLKADDRIEIDFSAAGPDTLLTMGVGGPQPPRVLAFRKTATPGCSCDGTEARNVCEPGWMCKTISVYGFTCGCAKQ